MADEMDPDKKAQILEVFETLDQDHDGLLKIEDLLEMGMEDDEAKEAFAKLDSSGTGSIDFPEFVKGWHLLGMDDLDLEDGDEDSDEEIAAYTRERKRSTAGSPGSPGRSRKDSVASSGEKKRRGSIVDILKMEELSRPKEFEGVTSGRSRRDSINGFEHAKTSKSNDERMAKILDWCEGEDSQDTPVALTELETTLRYLARPFTPEEESHMIDLLKARGYASITLKTLGTVLKAVQVAETVAKTTAKKKGAALKWSDDRFVHQFTLALKEALREPGAGVVDTSHEEKLAELQNEIRILRRGEQTAVKKAEKVKVEAVRLDNENTELLEKVNKLESEMKRFNISGSNMESSLKTNQLKADQMVSKIQELEQDLGVSKQEYQNMNAMLTVERKIKKTQSLELTELRTSVKALKTARSEANLDVLLKKVGKMKAISCQRQAMRKLQVANQRLPELEVENQILKEKIEKLEADIKEYLRLMDTFQHSQGNNALEMPETVTMGDMLADDAMERRVAELEAQLAEERRLRKLLEEEIERLKAEIASLQEALAEEKAARAALQQLVDELKKKIEDLEAQIAALKEELANLTEELRKEREERAAEKEAYEKRIAELEAEIAALKKQLEDEIAWRKRLQQQIDEMGTDAEKRLAALMAEMEELKKKLAELEKQLAEERARREELEKLLAEEIARREKAESELETTKTALEAALKRIAELEKENADLKAILADHEVETVTIFEEKQYVEPQFVPPPASKKKLKLSPEQQAEVTAYATCMNQQLAGDSDLAHLMPINVETPELLLKVSDGLLLAKFINAIVPGTIDERALNKRDDEDLTSEEILDNLTLVLSSAMSIGVTMTASEEMGEVAAAMGASAAQLQLMDCDDPQPSIDYIFHLVKSMFLQSCNVRLHPELAEICETPSIGLSKLKLQEVTPKELKRLAPEDLLQRWVNYHVIANATNNDVHMVKSFTDLKDGQGHVSVLARIAEKKPTAEGIINVTDSSRSDGARARFILETCKKLDITHFCRPANISSGNERLNMLLSAAIFNEHTGLTDSTQDARGSLGTDEGKDMTGDQREERAFRMWMNGAIPGVFIHDLFLDCMDGLTLLKVIDYIEPGHVTWKNVEMKPTNKFKCVSNCNYAVKLAKNAPLSCSLVGIDGPDIVAGHEQFILAIVWQLSRYHTLKKLELLLRSQGKGTRINDDMILKWANDMVSENKHEGNPLEKVKSFRDHNLQDSLFILNILYAVEPRVVDWKQVSKDGSPGARIRNAGYAISIARKLGAEIFLLPHDIAEVKPKMILLLVGSLMSIHTHRGQEGGRGSTCSNAGSDAVDALGSKLLEKH